MSRTASHSASPSVRGLADNRRRGRRHRLDIPATLVVGASEQSPARSLVVTITELSVAGVGLRCGEALDAGVVGELRAFDSLVPAGTWVKVVSHRSVTGGFELGAEILPPGVATAVARTA